MQQLGSSLSSSSISQDHHQHQATVDDDIQSDDQSNADQQSHVYPYAARDKFNLLLQHHRHHPRPSPINPSSNHPHHLLVRCAEFIDQSDFSSANRILSILQFSTPNSTYYYNYYGGDASDRLLHLFTRALSVRLHHSCCTFSQSTTTAATAIANSPIPFTDTGGTAAALPSSAYLSLNQITPFIRFSHLTANQAILEAITAPANHVGGYDHPHHYDSIHIIDFDILYGVQWPPLMQALADHDQTPPTLRITGVGSDIQTLRKTGDRLTQFAVSLGIKFDFRPIHLLNVDEVLLFDPANHVINHPTSRRREVLAVNCIHFLHRLLEDNHHDNRVGSFLRKVKAMNPKVVILAEREADHNNPSFIGRFMESLSHYGAIYESLEATLPPSSRERMEVEQVVFGKDVIGIVSSVEGDSRMIRHERFQWWEKAMRRAGFENVGMSKFSVSQAKLLLRLHYPSEGYKVEVVNDGAALFLGWKNRALFSISSWN